MKRRTTAVLLLLLAAGCASTPKKVAQGTYVPLAPRAQPLEQLLANLRSPVAGTRASAAWQLADAVPTEPGVVEALRTAYADPEERVREAAAWALGHILAGAESQSGVYDEAPRPARISRPTYPRAAFDARLEGTVELEILISSSGKVVHAEVRRSIPGLDAAAIDCVTRWSFVPARFQGRPAPAFASAPVTFRIY